MDELLTVMETLHKTVVSKGVDARRYAFEARSARLRALLDLTPTLSLCYMAGRRLDDVCLQGVASELGQPFLDELVNLLNRLNALVSGPLHSVDDASYDLDPVLESVREIASKIIREFKISANRC